ncbi:hypothetical protein PTKIN_Ptkin13bG0286900 [Pterospermum kingtungense]
MAPLSKKTIQHFTHRHPLTEFSANIEFICDGCNTPGHGTWYRCEHCDFDLHEYCGTCPMELSSFIHQHGLKLVHSKQRKRYCDLCGDPVKGLFYRCNLCDFDVHPPCTQLPQYVWHVMHKDHPLGLQGSMPGRCMVCKDTCTSWHYRCGICRFDLHPECVLAPSKEVTTTSTLQSLKTSALPPSTSPFLDPYHDCGSGDIPPPPCLANASRVTFVQPCFGAYGSSQVQRRGGNVRKKKYEIVENLALGVLSNVLFGTFFS